MSNTETAVIIPSNSTETINIKEEAVESKDMRAETQKTAVAAPKPLFHDVLEFNIVDDLIASMAEFFGTLFFIFMALTAVQVRLVHFFVILFF
jgi:hypothetical protein